MTALVHIAGKEERLKVSELRGDLAAVLDLTRIGGKLKGFVLIGDAAMTLRMGKRVSSELTFAYLGEKLPRVSIASWISSQKQPVHTHELVEHRARYRAAGYDLEDYQWHVTVGEGTDVTFYVPDSLSRRILGGDDAKSSERVLRVASVHELFALKSLACALRSKSSDWMDLYALMDRFEFTFDDMETVFVRLGAQDLFKQALSRLEELNPDEGDEGHEHLMENAPSMRQIRKFISDKLVAWQMGPLQKL